MTKEEMTKEKMADDKPVEKYVYVVEENLFGIVSIMATCPHEMAAFVIKTALDDKFGPIRQYQIRKELVSE